MTRLDSGHIVMHVQKRKTNDLRAREGTYLLIQGKHQNIQVIDTALREDAMQALNAWYAMHAEGFRLTSLQVYKTLWLRFISWLILKQKKLDSIDAATIEVFLNSLDAKREQRERYQKIITDVLEAWSASKNEEPAVRRENLSDPTKSSWRAIESNQKRHFLGVEQTAKIFTALSFARERLELINSYDAAPKKEWAYARDIALITLIFETGVHVAEAIALSVNCVEITSKKDTQKRAVYALNLQKFHGIDKSLRGKHLKDPSADALHIHQVTRRTVDLSFEATQTLHLWQSILDKNPIILNTPEGKKYSARLFPSQRIDGSNSLTDAMLNAATVARLVSRWGERAGIQGLTAQALRNTRAALWIEEGVSLEELDYRMGFSPGAASGYRLKADWMEFKKSIPITAE